VDNAVRLSLEALALLLMRWVYLPGRAQTALDMVRTDCYGCLKRVPDIPITYLPNYAVWRLKRKCRRDLLQVSRQYWFGILVAEEGQA
jgi:hypothetical protein